MDQTTLEIKLCMDLSPIILIHKLALWPVVFEDPTGQRDKITQN